MKLTQEEKETLRDSIDTATQLVLLKVMEQLRAMQEKELLSLSLEDERRIILAKAKCEGAKKMVTDFASILSSLRK